MVWKFQFGIKKAYCVLEFRYKTSSGPECLNKECAVSWGESFIWSDKLGPRLKFKLVVHSNFAKNLLKTYFRGIRYESSQVNSQFSGPVHNAVILWHLYKGRKFIWTHDKIISESRIQVLKILSGKATQKDSENCH